MKILPVAAQFYPDGQKNRQDITNTPLFAILRKRLKPCSTVTLSSTNPPRTVTVSTVLLPRHRKSLNFSVKNQNLFTLSVQNTKHDYQLTTEVFPCFFLTCKENAKVKPAKTGHGLHSSKMFALFYLFFFVQRCKQPTRCNNFFVY